MPSPQHPQGHCPPCSPTASSLRPVTAPAGCKATYSRTAPSPASRTHTCSPRGSRWRICHLLLGSRRPDARCVRSNSLHKVLILPRPVGPRGYIRLVPKMSHLEMCSAPFLHPNLSRGCDFHPVGRSQRTGQETPRDPSGHSGRSILLHHRSPPTFLRTKTLSGSHSLATEFRKFSVGTTIGPTAHTHIP